MSSAARCALVVLVAADGGGCNLEMVEQLLRLARVFAGDAVGAREHVEGAQGDVAEVADGRCDEIEAGGSCWSRLVRTSGRFGPDCHPQAECARHFAG